MSSLAETLRAARESMHLSCRDLARMTGVSAASISRLENGDWNVTLDLMRALTCALRLDIEIWFADFNPESVSFSPGEPQSFVVDSRRL